MKRSHDLQFGKRIAIPLALALAFLFSGSLRADEMEMLKSRFLKEASPGWKEYQAYAERLQGTMETVWTLEGKNQERKRFECKSNLNCYLGIDQLLLPKPEGWVHAYNASYGFTLQRKTIDGPWVLASFRPGPRDQEFWKPGATSLRSACIKTTTCDLSDLVRLPKFRVVAASKVQRGVTELCQIGFETHGGENKGTLLLDPSRFWTIRDYTLHRKESGGSVVNRVEIELSNPSAKYPIPKRSVLFSDVTPLKKPKFHSETVTEFNLKEVSRLPDDEEFTLSAFGLPEPGGPAKKPFPTYLWILVAAGVCAAMAFAFRSLSRRAAAKA
jgi:hypothetical protein